MQLLTGLQSTEMNELKERLQGSAGRMHDLTQVVSDAHVQLERKSGRIVALSEDLQRQARKVKELEQAITAKSSAISALHEDMQQKHQTTQIRRLEEQQRFASEISALKLELSRFRFWGWGDSLVMRGLQAAHTAGGAFTRAHKKAVYSLEMWPHLEVVC